MKGPPFETGELRKKLSEYLDEKLVDPISSRLEKVGNYRFGVYAFYDYDGEPIYVGQTNEMLRTRIRRHLTNQRTDAVAMKVLDPFEVRDVEVWPLAEYQKCAKGDATAAAHLNWLEHAIFKQILAKSKFGAVLNEKAPSNSGSGKYSMPPGFRRCIVSAEVEKLRGHPDTRLARRAETLAALAKVISERQVKVGLRRTLLTQAKRLTWLAEERLGELGGQNSDDDESV
jgi:GIY-YIG catalytic domain